MAYGLVSVIGQPGRRGHPLAWRRVAEKLLRAGQGLRALAWVLSKIGAPTYITEDAMSAKVARTILGAATTVLAVLFLFSPGHGLAEETAFIRGDANGDGKVSVSDAHWSLGYLFRNKAAPSCVKAADVNDNGVVDITDSIVILGHLFLAQGSPCEPFPRPARIPPLTASPATPTGEAHRS